MERVSLKHRPCPIARSLDQVGEWWSVLILRDVFLGTRRFAELQTALDVAPNILSRRLRSLCDHGLLATRAYSKKPLRHEYVLTEKGADFLPVLLALGTWGNRWLAPNGELLSHVDPKTKRRLKPVVVDEKTGKKLVPGEVAVLAGPGAPASVKKQLKVPRTFAKETVR